jgi:EmrB/QacA subfamily drug resistance transporter
MHTNRRQPHRDASAGSPRGRDWLVLAVLCAVNLMVALDLTAVNIGLREIESDLGLAARHVQWLISAYALAIGGFVLVGARAADVLGRRRVFAAGLALFGGGALISGLAAGGPVLIGGRGLQGIGAALLYPSALAMLSATFPEGRRRNLALGVWTGAAGAGAAAGVLLGAVALGLLSWRWLFFGNVPLAAVAAALTPVLPRDEARGARSRLDATAALLVTGGLVTLLLALTEGGRLGWSSPRALGLVVLALLLLAGFAVRERRAHDPLVPACLLRSGTVGGANAVAFVHGAHMLALFLLLTVYTQRVLGFSVLEVGAVHLAFRGSAIAWAQVAGRMAGRIGHRAVLAVGMGTLTASFAVFARAGEDATYAADLLPGLALAGLGAAFLFVGSSIAGLEGVPVRHAGVASGLITTSQWVGGALGVAAVSAIAASHSDLLAGLQAGFWACAAAGLLALAAIALLIPRRTLAAACALPA